MFHFRSSYPCLAVMTTVCLLGLIRGEKHLKIAALALLIDGYACEMLQDANPVHTAQPVIFLIDLAYCGLLIFLVYRATTRWPQAAAVTQILIVTMHLGAAFVTPLTRWDFFTVYDIVNYALFGALAYGALVESPRRRRRQPVAILRP